MSTSPFPLEPTAADAQAAIADEFGFFGDWSERYQYLIDLGRKLPEFPDAWKTEEHRLHGCQSLVWIVAEGDASKLDFHSISDSAIVSGLIYLALRVYSGRSAQEDVYKRQEKHQRDGLALQRIAQLAALELGGLHQQCVEAVSYTHLDVYKRQFQPCSFR